MTLLASHLQGPGEEGSSLSLPKQGHILGLETMCWDEWPPTCQGSGLLSLGGEDHVAWALPKIKTI